ncbi:2Fe-2S iron-sulfur cluster-binding protein [Salisaeta longa]|uniref:2Fe-2S iron-sulfur cluster-binding protein n=1 Tax=Salisaeta longa TaxID=503170 RepID=UPI0003B6F653|nr:2Fe-2S iron-sulfur cluster-binding protein [Salisaeta longa]
MPTLTIKDVGTFDVEHGTRLVRAMAEHIDIGHRCGGHAQCTTCRVRFAAGEPEVMTQAEHEKLHDIKQHGSFRLACQIVVDRDMTVEPLMTARAQGWDDPGPEPAPHVEPTAEWHDPKELSDQAD